MVDNVHDVAAQVCKGWPTAIDMLRCIIDYVFGHGAYAKAKGYVNDAADTFNEISDTFNAIADRLGYALNPQPRLGFAYDVGGGSGVLNLLVLKSLLKGRYADLILEKERGFDGLEKFSFATKSGRQYKTTYPDGHVDRRTCRCVADTYGKNI